ncbi:MAG: hypothetical protein GXO79_11465 [Chlorobi bacterium]|nr:hypothetical protein [Chlorobiota bacterium]
MNNRQKMYATNTKIKKYLEKEGFINLYFFPHLRFQKDWIVDDMGFDAIGYKKNDKRLWLFQFKTNTGCSKKTLEIYKKLSIKYNCVPCWITIWSKKKRTKTHPNELEVWEL